jgi:hypothetical protein
MDKNAVIQRLKDQFIKTWSSYVFNSSKSKICRLFKVEFGYEKHSKEKNYPT